MSDLIAFVKARLDEDEQMARQAASANPGSAADRWSAEKVNFQDWRGWRKLWAIRPARVKGIDLAVCHADILPKVANHIARHDPARVLSEVESKRRIMESLTEAQRQVEEAIREERTADAAMYVGKISALLDAAKVLAVPYDDHQDYRPDWRP